MHAFEFREGIEAVIEDFAKNLQSEVPGFVLTRGFFEGKYMLALRLDEELRDEQGRPQRAFSRLMFLLDPHADSDRFVVQAKKTSATATRDWQHHGHRGARGPPSSYACRGPVLDLPRATRRAQALASRTDRADATRRRLAARRSPDHLTACAATASTCASPRRDGPRSVAGGLTAVPW